MKPHRYKFQRPHRGEGWTTQAAPAICFSFDSRTGCGSSIDIRRADDGKGWTAYYRPTPPAGVPPITFTAHGRTLQAAAAAVQKGAEIAQDTAQDQIVEQAIGPQTEEERAAPWTRRFDLEYDGEPVAYRRCNRCRNLFHAYWTQHHDNTQCRQKETAA